MKTRVIVSAIIEKEGKIFLQTRKKTGDGAFYSGLLEIPAGGVEEFENVYGALAREVKEETGLTITGINDIKLSTEYSNQDGEQSLIFNPLFCQQMLQTKKGLHWVGFVFICQVEGKVKLNKKEASGYTWITKQELERLLECNPESFFPLQYGALSEYTAL